ncbi:MAG: hypothetical protein RIC95_09460 [Vicingaceae bacterium]
MKASLAISLNKEFPELSKEQSNLIVDNFCEFRTTKESMASSGIVQFLTINSVLGTGRSVKVKNIYFNLKDVATEVIQLSMEVTAIMTENKYAMTFAILHLVNKVRRKRAIDLKENHAIALKLMWENRNPERDWIEEDKAFSLFNDYQISKNRNAFIMEDFSRILRELKELDCIQKHNGDWWLKEKIRIKYK